MWAILLIGFVVRDFVQWWTHRLLHRVNFLWEFHKVHHSVEQMGFAAHLRYHWMETIVYRTIEYLPLALLGIGLYDFFVIHIFTLIIGHYNHSNITVDSKITGGILGGLIGLLIAFGFFELNVLRNANWSAQIITIVAGITIGVIAFAPVMKKIFNSPEMHIWHHAYAMPEDKKYGINFGLSLAVWDYLFGTAHVPHTGRDIKLGFPGVESFPEKFGTQIVHGLPGVKH
jgi:sterol desaturase/sphingolipid hydroxylase (fatty acid hydroxylase superfamily)